MKYGIPPLRTTGFLRIVFTIFGIVSLRFIKPTCASATGNSIVTPAFQIRSACKSFGESGEGLYGQDNPDLSNLTKFIQ